MLNKTTHLWCFWQSYLSNCPTFCFNLSVTIAGSPHLQFATVKVWTTNICNLSVSPEVKPIDAFQICANGPKDAGACKGDSGGPLFNTTFNNGEVRTYQVGIVSFGATQKSCGNPELPTVFTRVDQYLEWIKDNVVDDWIEIKEVVFWKCVYFRIRLCSKEHWNWFKNLYDCPILVFPPSFLYLLR